MKQSIALKSKHSQTHARETAREKKKKNSKRNLAIPVITNCANSIAIELLCVWIDFYEFPNKHRPRLMFNWRMSMNFIFACVVIFFQSFLDFVDFFFKLLLQLNRVIFAENWMVIAASVFDFRIHCDWSDDFEQITSTRLAWDDPLCTPHVFCVVFDCCATIVC